jgi:hypothetical protein
MEGVVGGDHDQGHHAGDLVEALVGQVPDTGQIFLT